nr:MAG TPA: hypothetical protein [Caudoviricetes sp.]
MKMALQVIGWVVVTFISIGLLIAVIGMIIPDKNESVAVRTRQAVSQTVAEVTEAKSDEYVICENDYIKATYLGIMESFGYVTLNVRIENKTDGEITVVPLESSVDDTMIQFVSGVPATMQGHKSINQAWIIGSEPQDNIEFKLGILDEHWSELAVTDVIRIEK